MLVPCVREYLRVSHAESIAGKINDRDLVNLFEAARSLYSDPRNAELGRKHGFELAEIFPRELFRSPIAKVAKFFDYRMKELSISSEPDSPSVQEPPSKVRSWTPESMKNSTVVGKEKSKGPEIEMD
jgi:hypothetical protein